MSPAKRVLIGRPELGRRQRVEVPLAKSKDAQGRLVGIAVVLAACRRE